MARVSYNVESSDDVDVRHVHAAARDDRDELVAHETLQSLTNRSATERELLLQEVVANDRAGGELERHDHLPDRLKRLLAE